MTIDKDYDQLQPERVRYLPQHFIENLCNEIATGDETNFERELKKVIFSHIPSGDRLHKSSLDELLEYKIAPHNKSISLVREKLRTINLKVTQISQQISNETLTTYEKALGLKNAELIAHEKLLPKIVEEPEGSADPAVNATSESIRSKQNSMETILEKLLSIKVEQGQLTERLALIRRLIGTVSNFEKSYSLFLEEIESECDTIGIKVNDIISMTIKQDVLMDALAGVNNRLSNLQSLVKGTNQEIGLEQEIEDYKKEISALQDILDFPQKLYQQYLLELKNWENRRSQIIGDAESAETIEYFKRQIDNIKTSLPNELAKLNSDRISCVREIHQELLLIRKEHQDIYKPVQNVAIDTKFTKESLQLEFDSFLAPRSFRENFLDFIHKGRKGTFYGEDEGRKYIDNLLNQHDFNSTDSVIQFVENVMNALTTSDRSGQREELAIQSQIRSSKNAADFYDFIFGLTYLKPHYTLKLGNKDISQLSPGEKGALLLVFYLLLDKEEIPIIIDQPEQNLDNQTVVHLLIGCIRNASSRRQVIIVTHNPNLAVVCDADQIICSEIDKLNGNRITYSTGAIEDFEINRSTVDILEGTYVAFKNRSLKYHKPL